jgi:hypothetical protein
MIDFFTHILFRYTWGTSRAHGFHGVYIGDQERLQEIQKVRDRTNRDWQRIILRNIGKSFGWKMEEFAISEVQQPQHCSFVHPDLKTGNVVEIRQLWWQVHNKMKEPDYKNMLLLSRMLSCLEDLMDTRKQKYITESAYANLVMKIHLDTEGCIVEPFVNLADKQSREVRQQMWYENVAMDLEGECLIK